MKTQILIAVAILSCCSLHAQQSNNLQNQIDSIFYGLSYDSIPTKILLDKSMSTKTAAGYEVVNDSVSDFDRWYALYKAAKDGSENRNNFRQYQNFHLSQDTCKRLGVIKTISILCFSEIFYSFNNPVSQT